MSSRPEAPAPGCNYPWLIRFWLFASTFTSVFRLFGYLGECLTSNLIWLGTYHVDQVGLELASVLLLPPESVITAACYHAQLTWTFLILRSAQLLRDSIWLLNLQNILEIGSSCWPSKWWSQYLVSTKDIILRQLRDVSNRSVPISRLVIPFARYKFTK